jgi:hypothetical protein
VILLNFKRIAYIRKASKNTNTFLECHTQHDCNTGGTKTGMQLCFCLYAGYKIMSIWLLDTSCSWGDEAMFRAVDVDWYYEGTYLEVQWFTGRVIGTPVLCTTLFCGQIYSVTY